MAAWFMLQRIRNAAGKDETSILGGDVEIDQTYLGGKEKNRHNSQKKGLGRGPVGKTVAFGMKERGGASRAFHVPSARAADISPLMIRNVALGSHVHADGNRAYGPLDSFYSVDRVNHSAEKYVRGDAHTNGIEGLWAITKRCYIGTHHWWSEKHTQQYLNAICFRQNTKEEEKEAAVNLLLDLGMDARLTYEELTQ